MIVWYRQALQNVLFPLTLILSACASVPDKPVRADDVTDVGERPDTEQPDMNAGEAALENLSPEPQSPPAPAAHPDENPAPDSEEEADRIAKAEAAREKAEREASARRRYAADHTTDLFHRTGAAVKKA